MQVHPYANPGEVFAWGVHFFDGEPGFWFEMTYLGVDDIGMAIRLADGNVPADVRSEYKTRLMDETVSTGWDKRFLSLVLALAGHDVPDGENLRLPSSPTWFTYQFLELEVSLRMSVTTTTLFPTFEIDSSNLER